MEITRRDGLFIIHFLNIAETDRSKNGPDAILTAVDEALAFAKPYGGLRYHNNSYGGGVSFPTMKMLEACVEAYQQSKIKIPSKMTPSRLKQEIQKAGTESYFFTRESMKFFGDTMKNYGCRSATVGGVECWELWRKRPVKNGIQSSTYFCKKTLKRIFD